MRFIHVHAGFGPGPDDGFAANADAGAGAVHGFFEGQLAGEQQEECAKTDDGGLFERAFAVGVLLSRAALEFNSVALARNRRRITRSSGAARSNCTQSMM